MFAPNLLFYRVAIRRQTLWFYYWILISDMDPLRIFWVIFYYCYLIRLCVNDSVLISCFLQNDRLSNISCKTDLTRFLQFLINWWNFLLNFDQQEIRFSLFESTNVVAVVCWGENWLKKFNFLKFAPLAANFDKRIFLRRRFKK